MPTTTAPLTTVTEAMFDALVDALDVLFPGQEGHVQTVDNMLDAEVIDRAEFQAGRDHADELAVLGTKPSLEHNALVGVLAISGFSHALGFIVQSLTHYR